MIFIWSQGRIFDKLETMRLAITVEISRFDSKRLLRGVNECSPVNNSYDGQPPRHRSHPIWFYPLSVDTKRRRRTLQLLQLRVLGLGLLQDGDVGVGVFPEGEEILVCSLRFGGIACHRIGASELEMGQCSSHKVQHDASDRKSVV